tara:strand:+ start:11925 stop:13136 length:1212 start_codon:yes stop_codon:yes gene_type:complete
MRITLLTQLFDPENAIKGLSFAKRLAAEGHSVDVITTFPSYPGGRVYPGYRVRPWTIEQYGDVRVIRVLSYITPNKSALRRMAGYCSFSMAALIAGILLRRSEVIYSYYPPVVGGLAAALLAFLKRSAMVYDVQDLWPEAVVATGVAKGRRLTSLIEWAAGIVYRRAGAIVVLSDGYREALLKKGVPPEKVFRIYNWCDESRITVGPPVGPGAGGFPIVYAGNLGTAQALEFVVRAAALVSTSDVRNIRFVFIGDGVERRKLQVLTEELGLANVEFVDRMATEMIGGELARAGALLVHLRNDPVFAITVPQKTQAYMIAGRPLLMAVEGECARIVQEAGAGIVAKPCDPADIARAAIELSRTSADELKQMGMRGASYYRDRMSQDNGVQQTLDVIGRVVGPRP